MVDDLRWKKIMFLSVLGLLRRRSDHCKFRFYKNTPPLGIAQPLVYLYCQSLKDSTLNMQNSLESEQVTLLHSVGSDGLSHSVETISSPENLSTHRFSQV